MFLGGTGDCSARKDLDGLLDSLDFFCPELLTRCVVARLLLTCCSEIGKVLFILITSGSSFLLITLGIC